MIVLVHVNRLRK